jgi:predicted transcriptional regulator
MNKIAERRKGGQERAKLARASIQVLFKNPDDPLYFAKDIEFAKKFEVTRHTIYKIREELKIPPRSERIFKRLQDMGYKSYSINDLSKILGIKYQNLYKIIKEMED